VIGISSLTRANRQRMILCVHLRLNMITLLDFSRHLGRFICMQTDFLAVLHLDEVVPVFDAGQFAFNRPSVFRAITSLLIVHILLLVIIRLKALPISLAISFHNV
jgi:hypothetical protein